MSNNAKIVIGILGVLVVCCLCVLCVLVASGAGLVWFANSTEAAPFFTQMPPLLTEVFTPPTDTPAPNIVLTPLPTPLPGAGDTLQTLEDAIIPESNIREEAMRLKGIPDIPETVSNTPANYQEGDRLNFWVINSDTNENTQITASLIYATDNAYFFAQDGSKVNKNDVKSLVDNFQDHTYPTDREFFGSEWNPGVDGDPHLYILYAHGLGSNVGGYYSSADEYSHLAHPYSNEKEMFYISADGVSPGDAYTYGTLAHEFQHMIHWHHDRNEETWMNEGASVLAEMLNGYSVSGDPYGFVAQPDLQLTAWVNSQNPDFGPHYGAAFLFMAYFLDRFGDKTTQALIADPANGLQAVDDVLKTEGATDPLIGKPITSGDIFADWVIANYLGDKDVSDGRYFYHNYANASTVPSPTDSFSSCPVSQQSTVHQYAADYYEINCNGQITINFTGSQQTTVIPMMPHGGRYVFWGNRNDESDTTLTREFDLTSLTSATLSYWMWAQIEKDFDYAYVEVSTNGGQTWQSLKTPSGTDTNPTGANFGWGYTGASGGGDPEHNDPSQWIKEIVDISAYAGQKILVRFEYVTDAALTYGGLVLDDISIPELNYTANFEQDDGGWAGTGFVRIDNLLPQTFVVQVIKQGNSGKNTTVERMSLDANNQGSLTLNLSGSEKAVLVVSGTTPFTTEVASYQFEVK